MADLATEVFLVVRDLFFDRGGIPKPFELRAKHNTQDDPLDEWIHAHLSSSLPTGVVSTRAPGPLISPDLVVSRPALCDGAPREALLDSARIVAVEVKKLERKGATVARASGMDYNTTPPCGTVQIYDSKGTALAVRGFYLFVTVEPAGPGRLCVSTMALCDGDLLNADFSFYRSIVGQRTKLIGLGTYGDGANRNRPMLIFSNPLGVSVLDRRATLIHANADLEHLDPRVRRVGRLRRTPAAGGAPREFHCFRIPSDAAREATPFDLLDVFPSPKRVATTQGRGRFTAPIHPID